jgi:hypothetical protein
VVASNEEKIEKNETKMVNMRVGFYYESVTKYDSSDQVPVKISNSKIRKSKTR